MVTVRKKKLGRKQKVNEEPKTVSQESDTREVDLEEVPHSTRSQVPHPSQSQANPQVSQQNVIQSSDNSEDAMEVETTIQGVDATLNGAKKTRGPTKMKSIAIDPASRIEVEFNAEAEPIGQGSIHLSSYLGPLVREHVPYTLVGWRKLDEETKVVLWESIQVRFKLEEGWQKVSVFQQMGHLWRASKSRLVRQIERAKTKEQKLQLKPDNIKSIAEWKNFVKSKTNSKFKSESQTFKDMRRKQVPHTCSRKGMARLAAEMKKKSADPASVSRVKVWVQSRTRKNGEPVNTEVGKTIAKIQQIEQESPSNITTNVREDALTQLLGQDKPGRLRAMGRGITITKLSFSQARDKHTAQLTGRVSELEDLVRTLLKNQAKQSGGDDNVSQMNENGNTLDKCELLDWSGTEEIVAEGRVLSIDPKELVNQIPIGPNAKKVLVDISKKSDAFLWRPTSNMTYMGQAENEIVAWPTDRVVLRVVEHSEKEDNVSNSGSTESRCKLLDWSGNEVVAEGRLYSSDPTVFINNIPLGPSAMIVRIDVPKKSEAFLWRPTLDMTYIRDAVGKQVAWPDSKVVVEKTPENAVEANDVTSPSSVNSISKIKKCKLIDVSGSGKIVATGRWVSSDPKTLVHHKELGDNAMKVWVDVPLIPAAPLWRITSALECIEDAFGSTVAWPADKVIME